MKIRDPQDFWAGMMFMAFGAAAIFFARNYAFGSAARMGPGYFPSVLGGLLIGLGLITSLRGLAFAGPSISRFNWKPLLWVLGSIVLFAAALQGLGLVIAIFLLIIGSALGGHEFKLKEVLILGLCLTLASVAIFVYGLHLQFPVFPGQPR
ncbi:MAG: tripartite tricarboxylate transporter TctB family protein [Rhodocyclaceae bacterium]|nr:MAG: tripartite tricarboxylate transporter TctB family protein [Rhodocyclaceae bacterium]